MPDPRWYLLVAALVAGTSAIVALVLAWRRWPLPRWFSPSSLACLAGLAAGHAAGIVVLPLSIAWPPASGLHRLLTIVLPATFLIEVLAASGGWGKWLGWPLRLVVVAGAGRVLLHNSIYLRGPATGWSTIEALATLAAMSVILLAVWAFLWLLARRTTGVSLPLSLAMTVATAGFCIALTGYIQGGAAGLVGSAALAGVSLGLARQQSEWQAAAVSLGVVNLFGLVLVGRYFGELSTAAALVLIGAPLLAWIGELPLVRRQRSWQVASVRLLLVALPLVMLLVLAKRDFDARFAPLMMNGAQATPAATTAARP